MTQPSARPCCQAATRSETAANTVPMKPPPPDPGEELPQHGGRRIAVRKGEAQARRPEREHGGHEHRPPTDPVGGRACRDRHHAPADAHERDEIRHRREGHAEIPRDVEQERREGDRRPVHEEGHDREVMSIAHGSRRFGRPARGPPATASRSRRGGPRDARARLYASSGTAAPDRRSRLRGTLGGMTTNTRSRARFRQAPCLLPGRVGLADRSDARGLRADPREVAGLRSRVAGPRPPRPGRRACSALGARASGRGPPGRGRPAAGPDAGAPDGDSGHRPTRHGAPVRAPRQAAGDGRLERGAGAVDTRAARRPPLRARLGRRRLRGVRRPDRGRGAAGSGRAARPVRHPRRDVRGERERRPARLHGRAQGAHRHAEPRGLPRRVLRELRPALDGDVAPGLVGGELSVEVLGEGIHSGASGIVPSSFRILRQLLSRLEDERTGEIRPRDLHVEIPPARVQQAKEVAATLGDLGTRMPFVPGMRAAHTDQIELVLAHTWRPALAITGADGIPSIADGGNVLRPRTAVKVSLRVPPTLDAPARGAPAEGAVRDGSAVRGARPVHAGDAQPGLGRPAAGRLAGESLERASTTHFGRPPMSAGVGGSIPFMSMLGERYPRRAVRDHGRARPRIERPRARTSSFTSRRACGSPPASPRSSPTTTAPGGR